MTPQDIEKLQLWYGAEVTPCGSRVTCNPAPVDTDTDYLVFVATDDHLSKLLTYLDKEGWQWEGATEHYQNVCANTFTSFRRGSDNLIVTKNRDFVRLHKIATRICTRLNIMEKPDRIMVFQAVLYGNTEWGL